MKTYLKIAAIAVCFISSLQPAYADKSDYMTLSNFGVAVGDSFPIDSLVDLEGKAITADKLHGKAVLINFYTQHCPPCIREVPKLNQVMLNRKDINVLAITPDSRDKAVAYVKQYGLNWPVAADAQALLSNQLNVDAYPGFALLDAKGRLLATVYANQLGGKDGHATVEGIEAWVNFQLSKAEI